MGYAGLTGFMKVDGGRKLVSEVLGTLSIEWADKSPEELRTILAPELQKIADLMEKADRVDELERQVKNLEWQMSEEAQTYRDKLAADVQRSRDSANDDS